jgi:hypothetical protein
MEPKDTQTNSMMALGFQAGQKNKLLNLNWNSFFSAGFRVSGKLMKSIQAVAANAALM